MSPDLLDALGRIVGPQWVRHRKAELKTYAMDGLPTRESYPGMDWSVSLRSPPPVELTMRMWMLPTSRT